MLCLPILRKKGAVIIEFRYQSQATPNPCLSVTHTCGAQLSSKLILGSVVKSVRT